MQRRVDSADRAYAADAIGDRRKSQIGVYIARRRHDSDRRAQRPQRIGDVDDQRPAADVGARLVRAEPRALPAGEHVDGEVSHLQIVILSVLTKDLAIIAREARSFVSTLRMT